MSKIPTAKLILTGKETYDLEYSTVSKYDALEAMIEFAKLHVEEALKQASEKANLHEDYYNEENFSINELKELANEGYPRKDSFGDIYAVDIVSIDKNSILNAYSLENIK
jgi:uncharacterized protein YqfB (UPF0267 family)